VLKNCLFTTTLAVACAGVALGAQGTTTTSSQRPTAQQPGATTRSDTTAGAQSSTTITGCVYKEADVPGRTPNLAEKAGIMEDYILATVQTSTNPSSGSAPSATGTSGTSGSMYKLEKIADERLRAVVGKRVEVTGRIDSERDDNAGRPSGTTGSTAQSDRSLGPDRINLPEFEVSEMREVSGTCPSSPSAR
jgi:hypothetical protein